MNLKETLSALEALHHEKTYAQNAKNGAGEQQYGVKRGDIRKMAKKIKTDHELAMELWGSGNLEARMLATLTLDVKRLSAEELDHMVREATFEWLADWLNSYVVKLHVDREAMREKWLKDADPMAGRAGWNLTMIRVRREAEGLDIAAILDTLETEMPSAPSETQWTMNFTLIEVGLQFPEHRERAIAIGESLGIYRDYPVSKGCVSPFAPIAIREMASRQS